MGKGKETRGGKREGAGRKAGEPTKLKRIPVVLEPAIDRLILKHKEQKEQLK